MKKVFIDFHIIPIADPKALLIVDTSQWEHIENKPSIIEITIPGAAEPITHYFDKNKINVFNSINLLVNCQLPCGCDSLIKNPLPDGVYIITVKGSPSKFNKTIKYLRTNALRLEVDKLFLDSRVKCERVTSSQRKKLDEIDFLITSAEANTRLDQIQDAQELFLKAQSLFKKCKANGI
jgi:molecular chaperone DnaK (HSP70)